MNQIGRAFLSKTKLDVNNSDIVAIVDFLSSADSINKMIVVSDLGLPALTGVVKDLEEKFANCKGFPLNHNAPNHNAPNRRSIGWMIKFIMKQVGYSPIDGGLSERARLRDFAGSKYFSTSAIYRKDRIPNLKINVELVKVSEQNVGLPM
jgi:hypothetical protein|nr:MAG TPA: hypothetical protein [Caudoviricetes sp.]